MGRFVSSSGPGKASSGQAGIGLVEIMVAMAIGVFMLGGILSLVIWVSQARVELDKTSEQIENGRYAIQLLSGQLRLAGFYGPTQIGATNHVLSSPCQAAMADQGIVTPGQFPAAVQGYASLPAAGTDCLSDAKTGSEALVIRRVDTSGVPPKPDGTAPDAGPHLQWSECEEDNGKKVVYGDSGFSLRQKDCSTKSLVWPYQFRAYYIGACDLCPGDAIPTLKTVEYRKGNLLAAQSLVEGIEDIHFQYGVDKDGNGSPDCYAAPDPDLATLPAGCLPATWASDPLNYWADVVSVRVSLLARSIQPSSVTELEKQKTYDLGRVNASTGQQDPEGPFDDGYRRQVYSVVVMLPNISGVRE